MKNKTILLFSGGLDSTTCLYWIKQQGWPIEALLFDYGQRHKIEMQCARSLLRLTRTPHHVVRFRLPWGGSSLIDKAMALPKMRSVKAMGQGVPSTYVPARNTLFLSFALSLADATHAGQIVIGANALDYSGYPDCRPKYMAAYQTMARAGTRLKSVKIIAPLVNKTKAEIICLGKKLGVPYEKTWSCYQGGKRPCGKCDSCLLRAKGFQEAGIMDPALGR